MLSSKIANRFIAVKGTIGKWKDRPVYNQTVYGVPLSGEDGSLIKLVIPQKELKDCVPGKTVVVHGFLRPRYYNSQFEINLVCTKIIQQELSEQAKEQESLLYELITSCRRYRKDFPVRESYRIAVICGRNSQAFSDFKEELLKLAAGIELVEFAVNIQNVDEIIDAVEKISGQSFDVVCVVRGGGDEGEFHVFNHVELVNRWLALEAFTVSAIGHTAHRTVIDFFSDRDCITPTKAGAFIRESITKVLDFQDLVRYRYQVNKDIEQIRKDLDERKKELESLRSKEMYYRAGIVLLILLLLFLLFLSR